MFDVISIAMSTFQYDHLGIIQHKSAHNRQTNVEADLENQ